MSKPIAVLISDIHYNLKNLELADKSMRQAIAKANDLQVPLIVAGDLHDSKANLRAECVNAMIETFKLPNIKPIILRGNHDSLNEKSTEHSLEFLRSYAHIQDNGIMGPCGSPYSGLYLCPYYSNTEELKFLLTTVPKGSIVIMHQGIQGSDSGEYIQDRTAITKDDVAGLRVISGHYHKRQTIDLPDGGKWDYIGNPYTQNFAEANDPKKGYQILMDDGSLEFVPTDLRKHIVVELVNDPAIFVTKPGDLYIPTPRILPSVGDLVWVKYKAPKALLAVETKEHIRDLLGCPESFKLDLIPTDIAPQASKKRDLTQPQLLDSIIDSLAIDDVRKTTIKNMWKSK